jgi:cohesin loading factor subunit SCC2
LDDVKSSNSQQSESSNAAKTIALDHLGVVAARIRTSMLNVQHHHSSTKSDGGREKGKSLALKALDEVCDQYHYISQLTRTECADHL